MEITGKLIRIMPEMTGQGAKGPWSKRDIIVEQGGQYPKKACITVWGTKISLDGFGIGSEIKCQVEVESREHNGKWYTEVKAWKVEGVRVEQPSKATDQREWSHADNYAHDKVPQGVMPADESDLPF